jgi:hypothetical protein
MPCKYSKCIKYLSSGEIRESISNNSLQCQVIQKVNQNEWCEKIIYTSTLTKIYSIENIIVNDSEIYCYSKDIEGMDDDEMDKRENEFSGFKCVCINETSSKLIGLLVFEEFEMGQDIILDSTIKYLVTLKNALKS